MYAGTATQVAENEARICYQMPTTVTPTDEEELAAYAQDEQ